MLTLLTATFAAASVFSYNAKAPIDIRPYGTTRVQDAVVIRDVTYADPLRGRVTAYIVTPERAHPQSPGIIFAHWCLGNRNEFLPEAIAMAKRGFVSILPDDPQMRPAPWTQPMEGAIRNPEQDRGLQIRAVIDLRRAIDVLTSLADPSRLAYVGHSCNASNGGDLAGVERRLKGYVLIGGSAARADFDSRNFTGAFFAEQGYAQLRKVPQQLLKRYSAIISPLDPLRFIGHAAAAVYMQFGEGDAYVTRYDALRYFGAASEPKKISWYPGGHEIDSEQARSDRAQWLMKLLSLRPRANANGSRLPHR